MKKIYTAEVIEENGECILPLPEDMLKEVGWKEGDVLKWDVRPDGTYVLSKMQDGMDLYLVETLSSFKIRYLVQVPKGKPADWALDTVAMEQAHEFSQKHINESILSSKKITEEEMMSMHREDNSYLKGWDAKEVYKAFVTTIEESGDIVQKDERENNSISG